MNTESELAEDKTEIAVKSHKHRVLRLNHSVLATIESTRTILGILQSPVAFTQPYTGIPKAITDANHLGFSARKETYKPLPTEDEIHVINPVCLQKKWNESFESFENSENVTPNPQMARNNLSSEYDLEHARRIACENSIGSLQEKVLSMEQENAVLKLENHKKDLELRRVQETLDQIKYSWKNTEDYLSSITESHSTLEKQLEEATKLNSNLAKELSNSTNELKSLRTSEHHLKFKYDNDLVKFPIEIENLTKQLENQEQRIAQYQKDIRSYQNELFTVQKENQDIIRAKVKLETNHENESLQLTKKLSDMERSNLDLKNANNELLQEIQALTQSNQNLSLKINNLESEKIRLEEDFRKSEANKIAQDVENLATIKNILLEKEAEFEEFQQKLAILKSEEMESLKFRYENIVREIRSHHHFQVEDLLKKIKDTELSKEKSLDSIGRELELAKNKIEKLKSGRNKILSRLQIHLQNQWKESVELLYADEEDTSDISPDLFRANWLNKNNSPNECFNTPKSQKLSLTTPEFSKDTKLSLSQNTPFNNTRESRELDSSKTPKYNTEENLDSKCDSETLQRYIKMLLVRESVINSLNSAPEQICEADSRLEMQDQSQCETNQNQVTDTNKIVKLAEKSPPWK